MATTEQDLLLFVHSDPSELWWEGAISTAAGSIEEGEGRVGPGGDGWQVDVRQRKIAPTIRIT